MNSDITRTLTLLACSLIAVSYMWNKGFINRLIEKEFEEGDD